MLNVRIIDFDMSIIDNLISPSMDIYASVDESSVDDNDDTATVTVNVKTVAVTEETIVFDLPDGSIFVAQVPSNHYHKIEVI